MVDVSRHRITPKLCFLLIPLVAGCITSAQTASSPVDTATVTCDSAVCADDGFKVPTDGFSFANWGEDFVSAAPVTNTSSANSGVTVQMMVDLFGHNVVCHQFVAEQCVLTPRAQHLQKEWNAALRGGRCEGMATLSERMFLALAHAQDFDTAAAVAADLDRHNPILESQITYWWATQFTDDVMDVAAESRSQSLIEIVRRLIDGLQNSAGYTLGLYDKGMGHAVTPFAVTTSPQGWDISVYDNNYPGAVNHVKVDAATQSWSYMPRPVSETQKNDAYQISSTNADKWSGVAGSLELTPMKIRSGPFRCETCDDQIDNVNNKESIVISLIPQSVNTEVSLLITTEEEETLVATASQNTVIPPNVSLHVSKDGTSPVRTQLTLPSSYTDFDIHILSSALSPDPPPVLLTVSHPGIASVHLVGDFAQPESIDSSVSSHIAPIARISPRGLRVTAPVETEASIATSTDIADVSLAAQHELTISTVINSTISIQHDSRKLFTQNFSMSSTDSKGGIYRTRIRRNANTYTPITNLVTGVVVTVPTIDVFQGPTTSKDFSTNNQTPQTNNTTPERSSDNPEQTQTSVVTPTTIKPVIDTAPNVQRGHVQDVLELSATPHLLTVDSLHRAWLREGNNRSLLQVDPSGHVQYHSLNGLPVAATHDTLGNIWALLQQPSAIVRISDKEQTYYTHPDLHDPRSLSFDTSGKVLHIVGGRNSSSFTARFTTETGFKFQQLDSIIEPSSLVSAADGSMWFIDAAGLRIAKIDTNNTLHIFQRSIVMARDLAQGPDGAMWFVNNVNGYEIGRISKKGTYSFFSAPVSTGSLHSITLAIDNSLWFASENSLLRMSATNEFVTVPHTRSWGLTKVLASGDGFGWFANTMFRTLSRIKM